MSESAVQNETPSCPKCQGAMWDNRESKRNPRAPDFKCRDKSCEGVIWPPRDAQAAPAPVADQGEYVPREWPAPAGTEDDPACPVCSGKMWDDRASKRNPRAPDFKCRNKPKFMGGPGCQGVIWPPRDGEPRRAPAPNANASAASARRVPPPPRNDAPPPSDTDFPGYEDDDLPF